MASDPFNSAGGYTVGIPPYYVIEDNGNVNTPQLTGIDANFSGNVVAPDFYGLFHGDFTGNLTFDMSEKQIVFTDAAGSPNGSQNLTFDTNTNDLTLVGNFFTDSITLGTGETEFSTNRVNFAATASDSPDQVLHTTPANTICSIDYTIIATNLSIGSRQTSKLFATVFNEEVGYFEYGTIDVPLTGPGVGDFKVKYESGNVMLTVTPVSSTVTEYKIMVTSYKE